ncbi:MAG: hypothetical protein AAFQ89_00560 [Cyanobacteria bacterium J06626_18]
MKRLFLASLTVFLAAAVAAPAAFANQTDKSDLTADANGDGKVTLSELRRHNQDARQKN